MPHTIDEWKKDRQSLVKVNIEEQRNGHIITGIGAGKGGSGCRTTLFHLARRTVERISNDKKVCVVDLHLSEPTMDKTFFGYSKLNMHLDNLYQSIDEEVTAAILNENVVLSKDYENLFLLAGTRRPFAADAFNAEVLMAMLEGLRCVFDVIYVNISAHFDNPGTVAALHCADHILLCSNYDEDGLALFNHCHNTIYKYHPELEKKFHLIGIDNRNSGGEDMKKLVNVPLLTEFPYIADWRIVFSEKNSVNGKNKDLYEHSLDTVLDTIQPIEMEEIAKERKWKLWPTRRLPSSSV